MITKEVNYNAGDRSYTGFLAVPGGPERRAAVLVAHEAPGLGPHIRSIAVRLAELGYVAFALDYVGEGRQLSDFDDVMRHIRGWTAEPASLRQACAAAHEILISREDVDPDRTAAFGYCFGAQALLEYARTGADLAAIVGFHPGLGTNRPEEARSIRSRLLMFVGADDPITPRLHRNAFEDEMSAASVPWRMVVYSSVAHAFSNPSVDERRMAGFAYDRGADTDSWNSALAFLETVFWQKYDPSPIKS